MLIPLLPPNRLRWTGLPYERCALRPRLPDFGKLRLIASRYLPHPENASDVSLFEIKFFAEGATNKLYSISYSGCGL